MWQLAALCVGLSTLSCITSEDIFGLDETKLIAKVSGTVTLRMFESEPVTIDLSESSGDCWRDSWTEHRFYQYGPGHVIELYCLDVPIYVVLRIPLDQEDAVKQGDVYIDKFEIFGEFGYGGHPKNDVLKDGCDFFYVRGTDKLEVLSEHQSGTDFPIEFQMSSEPGGQISTRHCIDFDIHILIPQQEQEIPYDRKTPPMSEGQRNLEKKLNSDSTEQEE